MAAVTVTTSPTLLHSCTVGTATAPEQLIITNNSGGTVYLGKDSTVTVSSGLTLLTASAIGLDLVMGDDVYGIASSSLEVRVEGW
jgi:hypothetical protein